MPAADDAAIAALVAPFRRVVVECHPRRVGARALAFARRLPGRLEVAMGLETVHPEALVRLRKKIERDPAHPRIVVSVKGAGYAWGVDA